MTTAAPFAHSLRIYWEDTDAGGVVFYANYLKFFERARTEWLRARGFEQEAMRQRDGVMFVVSSTSLRYLRPARLDDRLRVTVEPRELGRASMLLFQRAYRLPPVGQPGDDTADELLLAEGEIRIGCVASGHATDLKPTRMPASLLEALKPLDL